MSKVAIQGNASGTGTFTIAAPDSNENRTLTLPDEAGTVLTSASSIPVANLDSAVGITNVTQFRMVADTNNNTDADVTTNIETVDDASSGSIGSAVTQSSGIFTFPSTGIWMVMANASFIITSDAFAKLDTYVTLDNSNYDQVTEASDGNSNGAAAAGFATSLAIVDVTDTSNVKVKFRTGSFSGAALRGDTNRNYTSFTFIRLGDT